MPENSLQRRAARAKAKGTTLAVKARDVGEGGGRSRHAAKKSGSRVAQAGVGERSVSGRKPPGRGRTTRSAKLPTAELGASSTSRRKTLPAEAAAGYRKDGRAKRRSPDAGTRPRSSVSGRKKPASQLRVKRRGGPFKRSRLHGG